MRFSAFLIAAVVASIAQATPMQPPPHNHPQFQYYPQYHQQQQYYYNQQQDPGVSDSARMAAYALKDLSKACAHATGRAAVKCADYMVEGVHVLGEELVARPLYAAAQSMNRVADRVNRRNGGDPSYPVVPRLHYHPQSQSHYAPLPQSYNNAQQPQLAPLPQKYNTVPVQKQQQPPRHDQQQGFETGSYVPNYYNGAVFDPDE